MERRQALCIRSLTSLLIAGPSGCGKTVFTTKLLLDNAESFAESLSSIHYSYGSWQKGFDKLKKGGVKFHEGIPDSDLLPQWLPKGGVLVMDDLMDEGSNDKRVLDLFTKHSHHRNITVIYLCLDLFPNGNTPRPSRVMVITWWLSKTPEINWGYGTCYCNRFPNDGKRYWKRFAR